MSTATNDPCDICGAASPGHVPSCPEVRADLDAMAPCVRCGRDCTPNAKGRCPGCAKLFALAACGMAIADRVRRDDRACEVRRAAVRYVTGDRRILGGPACGACGADTLHVDGALCVRCEARAEAA